MCFKAPNTKLSDYYQKFLIGDKKLMLSEQNQAGSAQ